MRKILNITSCRESRRTPLLSRNILTSSLFITFLFSASLRLQASANVCDLNGDGVVNNADVQLAVKMDLGEIPCTANLIGAGVCNVAVTQRIANASTGGVCDTSTSHGASLAWKASTSSGIKGYNIYRGLASGGPYSKLNSAPVSTTSYADATVAAGRTYFYVTTAVASAGESRHSNEVKAVIP